MHRTQDRPTMGAPKPDASHIVTEADLRARKATNKPPDGAYAWLVIGSCFFSLMFSIGINDAYGVYQQNYQLNEFPEVSATMISWIGTVQFLCMCFCGVFAGVVCERFDARLLNAAGALIMGAALVGGSFAKSAKALMVLQGLLYGVGASFPFVAATSVPAQWFTKHRGLATGIALSGSGIGGMWVTSATSGMIEALGRPWAMGITGITSTALVLAVSPWMQVRFAPHRRERIVDRGLFKNPKSILFLAAVMFAVATYAGPFYQVPSYSVVVLDKPEGWGSDMDTLMNAASVVGRVVAGLLADWIGPLNLMILNAMAAIVSLLVGWVPFDSVCALYAVAVAFGFSIGGIVSVTPVVAAQVFGFARFQTPKMIESANRHSPCPFDFLQTLGALLFP